MFRSLLPVAKKRIQIATYFGIGSAAFLHFNPNYQFTKHLQSKFVAHAASAWQPHPELPPPRTISEAVSYNDYPPGYSEPIPDYSTMPPIGVKKVVASNLEEHIMDPNKDTFVQFSQEKCASCQSFQRITDAMAFAFRDVPTVQFLEIKGTNNYIPGILTAEEEVLFPTFKYFPAGTQKQVQMQRSKEFVKMVREYNQKVLSEHDPDSPLPPKFEPALAKSKFEGVGYSMPMSASNEDQYVWETFIDVMWDKSTVKFDKDAVKKQLAILEPALKREISHTIRSNLPGYELLASLSPCGPQWDGFQDVLLRRGVGSTKMSEFYDNMTALRQCIADRYTVENAFWKDMMKLSIHMSKTLDVVQQAKRNEGLTPDQARVFFTEYSKTIQQQSESRPRTADEKTFANIPRGQ